VEESYWGTLPDFRVAWARLAGIEITRTKADRHLIAVLCASAIFPLGPSWAVRLSRYLAKLQHVNCKKPAGKDPEKERQRFASWWRLWWPGSPRDKTDKQSYRGRPGSGRSVSTLPSRVAALMTHVSIALAWMWCTAPPAMSWGWIALSFFFVLFSLTVAHPPPPSKHDSKKLRKMKCEILCEAFLFWPGSSIPTGDQYRTSTTTQRSSGGRASF